MIHSAQNFREQIRDIFQKNQNMESDFQIFLITDPRKSVFGPGDVFACFSGPQIYRFVYRMENVPQTLSDTLYKLFLCMFPSIWH